MTAQQNASGPSFEPASSAQIASSTNRTFGAGLHRAWAKANWMIGAGVIAALASVPIVAVIWALFANGDTVSEHVWTTLLPSYAVNTLALMAMVGVLCAIIGVGTAWIVTAMQFPGRRIISWLLVLPLAAPAYLIAYLYTDLLEFSGPLQSVLRGAFNLNYGDYWFPQIRSLPGAALLMSFVLYPYVYLLARAAFASQSRSQFLAARSLGASPARAFWQVVLPAARPAIAGGLALVLMETLADYGVADYFAIPTLSTGVFRSWLAMGDRTAAMKIAAVMLLFVILLVAVEALSRRGAVAADDRLSAGAPPFVLSPFKGFLAALICAIPVVIGFVIPVVTLSVNVAAQGDGQGIGVLAGYAGNSLKAAGVAALIASVLAIFLAYAERISAHARLSGAILRGGVRVATLGYALPGALLAVGLLAPLGQADRAITRFARDTFGFDQGLILTGTIALLTYALVVRFLTVSFNSVSGGLSKVSPSMDAAARSLGASRWGVLRHIHIPLIAPSIAYGGALVFIDVMRELPATLILRPFNFETLATRVYRLASDERLVEASGAALIIIALGVLPVILINRVRT